MPKDEDRRNLLTRFTGGVQILKAALEGLDEKEWDRQPSSGGWTIRRIVHHLADGDDIWKLAIKIAMGNQNADFKLNGYWSQPQTAWSDHWHYPTRSVDLSLRLLEVNRAHIVELLASEPDCWNNSIGVPSPQGKREIISIREIVQMQADHIDHHVKRIREIRTEVSAKKR